MCALWFVEMCSGARFVLVLWCASFALLISCVETTPPRGPSQASVGVYAVWVEGDTDDNRPLLDSFFDCLIHNSTFVNFWGGRVKMHYRGSVAVQPPANQLLYPETDRLLQDAFARGDLPLGYADERAVYVVFASGTAISLQDNACGRTAVQSLHEGGTAPKVAVAFVRNNPLCWPTRDRLRTETQIAMHELAEATELLLGAAPCVGDGACEGRASCAEDYCDNFYGLACEGAPVGTFTGCEGRQVDGWVIQTLASAGRQRTNCETCMVCDFAPQVCDRAAGECP